MIVLTGGAGFIGSCLLRKLNDEDITDILVVDHLGNGQKWKNLLGKKFIDYCHKDKFLQDLISGKYNNQISSVIHFGACSSTTEVDADYLMSNNYSYSKILAEFCIEQNARFIYASSAATYGDGNKGYSDNDAVILSPMNGYGFSKHAFDLWVIQQGYDKIFTGIKFFNVFGPNEYHKANMSSMVYKSYNQILKTGKVCLFKSNSDEFSDGCQMRDFIYVKDCNEVIFKFLQNPAYTGILNLGTGNARTWNDLANAVFKALDITPVIEYIDMPESISSQYQNYTKAEMQKLSDTGIDFNPLSLEDSVKDFIQNYLSKNELIY
jgi:ADP-L-glycero-D-manno-heptose 6-epimerase